MEMKPLIYGYVDGEAYRMSRFNTSKERRHGLIFTDNTQNGQYAYRDIAEIIEHEAHINGGEVYLLDPSGKFDDHIPADSMDTHNASEKVMGSPAKILFPDDLDDPIELGIHQIDSLLVSYFKTHGNTLSNAQRALFFELVKQAYTDTDAPHTSMGALFGGPPTLTELVEELIPLLNKSSQPRFHTFAESLEDILPGGKYGKLGRLEGTLEAGAEPVQRYTLDFGTETPHELHYQALLNCIMTKAHMRETNTWVVLSGYEHLLSRDISQQSVTEALNAGTDTNTYYDLIVENPQNHSVNPPLQDWGEHGAYTRYYTPDAPHTFNTQLLTHAYWLDGNPSPGSSRSLLARAKSSDSPYQLETPGEAPEP